jgi:hypothetical protein
MASQDKTVGVEPWDTELAAHEAAMDADEDKYREALRSYCRAGRDEALRIRGHAA